jgi:hypothetical protein
MGLGMQLGADVLDLGGLKGALPRHRNLERVVDGAVRRVRTRMIRWLDGASLTLLEPLP